MCNLPDKGHCKIPRQARDDKVVARDDKVVVWDDKIVVWDDKIVARGDSRS